MQTITSTKGGPWQDAEDHHLEAEVLFTYASAGCPLCEPSAEHRVFETQEAWWCVCPEHGARWAIHYFGCDGGTTEEALRSWAKSWELLENFIELCGSCADARTFPLEGPTQCNGCGRNVCPACRAPYDPVQRRPDPPVWSPECWRS